MKKDPLIKENLSITEYISNIMNHKSTGSYIRMVNNNLGFDFIITNLEKGVLNIILADPTLGL